MRKFISAVLLLGCGVLLGALFYGQSSPPAEVVIIEDAPNAPAASEFNESPAGADVESSDERAQFYKDEIVGLGKAGWGLAVDGWDKFTTVAPRIVCGSEPVSLGESKKFACTITNPTTGKSFDSILTVADVEGLGFGVEFVDSTAG